MWATKKIHGTVIGGSPDLPTEVVNGRTKDPPATQSPDAEALLARAKSQRGGKPPRRYVAQQKSSVRKAMEQAFTSYERALAELAGSMDPAGSQAARPLEFELGKRKKTWACLSKRCCTISRRSSCDPTSWNRCVAGASLSSRSATWTWWRLIELHLANLVAGKPSKASVALEQAPEAATAMIRQGPSMCCVARCGCTTS